MSPHLLCPAKTRISFAFLLLAGILAVYPTHAQSFIPYEEVPVLAQDGSTLNLAWAGGLNNPQFGNIDANNDGRPDLFAFDRQGNVPLIFLADGALGAAGWTYSEYWSGKFPALYNWVVLRDVNCDGLEDILTSGNGGIVVYIGSRSGGLSFTTDTSRLTYVESSFVRYLGVLDYDIPEVVDVDGDGDMDILTFNLGGGYVEYYRNQAEDTGEPCGVFDLVLDDKCWGRFYESGLSSRVDLDTCMTGSPVERSGVHAGSTLMAFDEDGDGDVELVLGDLSFDNLNRLVNGGTPETALMTDQDTLYPAYDTEYHINQFPAAFYVDADQDGRRDMLVSPNSLVLGRDYDNVAFYKDVGSASDVVWAYQAPDFLVGDMVDVGRGANPVFFDHNGDGLLDIVVGNSAYTPAVGTKIGQLALLENTGTATEPAFRLINTDYAGISVFGFENVHPAFGDVDGDGDEDLVIGEEDGLIHLFVNNPVGSTASFSLLAPGWQGIDPGKTSTPFLADMDRDGDLDLLIGERNGNINYYRNEGSAGSASFTLVSETFGGIVLTSGPVNIGEVQPYVYDDPVTGMYRLYVGDRRGKVWRYDSWEADLEGVFVPVDSLVGNLDPGDRSRVAVADLNGDSIPELLLGNMRGGLSLYVEGEPIGISPVQHPLTLSLWPNPESGVLHVKLPVWAHYTLEVYDLQGRRVMSLREKGIAFELNTLALREGVYQILVRDERNKYYGMFFHLD